VVNRQVRIEDPIRTEKPACGVRLCGAGSGVGLKVIWVTAGAKAHIVLLASSARDPEGTPVVPFYKAIWGLLAPA